MDVVDLTRAALHALATSPATTSPDYDHDHAYMLRGKILGVLIRKSRLAAERTSEECAHHLQLEPNLLDDWEFGDQIPSLPQLELLSSYLDGHSSVNQNGASPDTWARQAEYLLLRQRLIGALLSSARETQGRSIEELSASTVLEPQLLRSYEFGEHAIPLSHLTILAQAAGRDLRFFLLEEGPSHPERPEAETSRAPAASNSDSDSEPSTGEHAALIRLAIAFREIDQETLQRVADALSALIKAKEESLTLDWSS